MSGQYANLDGNHDVIVEAFNELLDCDEDITFEAVHDFVQEENGIQITQEEYQRVSKLY